MYVFLRFIRFFQNPQKHDFLRFFELLHTLSRTVEAADRSMSFPMTLSDLEKFNCFF